MFVFSGIVNPERRQLRDRVLALGGAYRPDWTADATHLIVTSASSTDTPKYRQMAGKRARFHR